MPVSQAWEVSSLQLHVLFQGPQSAESTTAALAATQVSLGILEEEEASGYPTDVLAPLILTTTPGPAVTSVSVICPLWLAGEKGQHPVGAGRGLGEEAGLSS